MQPYVTTPIPEEQAGFVKGKIYKRTMIKHVTPDTVTDAIYTLFPRL